MADDVKPRRKRWGVSLKVGGALFGYAEGASILRTYNRSLATISLGSLTEERREVWAGCMELARKATPLPVDTVMAVTRRGLTFSLERIR